MAYPRSLPPVAALALLLAGSPVRAEEPQPLLPTRDVDISYRSTRPNQPKIVERRRWSASDRLVRSEGPDKSTTLYDRDAHEITIINPKNRTYLKLEGSLRQPLDPEKGKVLKRGGESVCRVALHRLVVDGRCGNAHRMFDPRRRDAASGRRRQDGDAGAVGEIRPAAGGAFPGTARLHAGAGAGGWSGAVKSASWLHRKPAGLTERLLPQCHIPRRRQVVPRQRI